MRVSQTIREKLINDRVFRVNVALALECSEQNVQELEKRNSDNLTKYAAVLVYKRYGLTDEQIFEPQTV